MQSNKTFNLEKQNHAPRKHHQHHHQPHHQPQQQQPPPPPIPANGQQASSQSEYVASDGVVAGSLWGMGSVLDESFGTVKE